MNTLKAEETGLTGFGRFFFWNYGFGSLLIDAKLSLPLFSRAWRPISQGQESIFRSSLGGNSIVSGLPLYTLDSIGTEFQVSFCGALDQRRVPGHEVMKLKILHCIPTLEIGGAQRQLSYLAPALAEMGHTIHVVFLHGGPNLARLESGGVVLHPLRSQGNHDPEIFLQLVGLFRRIRPDIIQTWILQMDVLAGIAAMVTGTPWILREPCSAEAYPRTIKNELRKWTGGRANAIVANSKAGESYWRAQRKPQICNVIPNCIPLTAIESAPPAPIWDLYFAWAKISPIRRPFRGTEKC